MDNDAANRLWRVLLVGGNSGAGKTVLTEELVRYFGVSRLLVDDVRLALQAFTSVEWYPDLHYFAANLGVWDQSAESLCDGLIRVGEVLITPLATIIAHHVVVTGAGPLIIEGDGIAPQLAAERDFAGQKFFYGLKLRDQVRSIFVVESDEDAILSNMHARGRGFDQLTPSEQRLQARTSRLYGQWLRQEAKQRGLHILAPRPWDTLAERALVALTNSPLQG